MNGESGGHGPLTAVLLWGVRASLVLMVGGLVLWVAEHRPLHAPVPPLGRLPELVARGDPAGILALGVICLLLTPVVGVAAVTVVNWRRRALVHAVVASVVLAILLFSITISVVR